VVGLIRYHEFGALPEREAFRKAFHRAREMGHITSSISHSIAQLPIIAPRSRLRPVALELATKHYEDQLWHYPQAQRYLSGRGVSMELAEQLRLGFCPGNAQSARTLADAADDDVRAELVAIGILTRNLSEGMYGRIIMPNIRHGKVVWMMGRRLDRRTPKYLGVRGPKEGFYGLNSLGNDGVVFVAEGAFDIIPFLGQGYAGIALLGTGDSQLSLLACKLAGRNIIILRDAGDGGKLMAASVAEALEDLCSIRVVEPPEGCNDPADWVKQYGIDVILATINKAEAMVS